MKKRNILNRILSLVFVFTLLLSGLQLDFGDSGGSIISDNKVTVNAEGWGDVATGDAGTTSAGKADGYPSFQGSGWRIYLVATGFDYGSNPLEGWTVFTTPKMYTNTRSVKDSILITSANNPNGKTSTIYSLYDDGTGDVWWHQTKRFSSITDVFGISGDGLSLQPLGDVNKMLNGDLSGNYWNTTFKNYVTSNKEEAINKFLSHFGVNSDVLQDGVNYCFLVEPVAFWYDGTCKAVSWLNISNNDGSAISCIWNEAMNAYKTTTSKLSTIKSSENATFKVFQYASTLVNQTTVHGYSVYRDVNSRDFLVNGYGVFGAEQPPISDPKAKTSASFSMFYDGTPLEYNKKNMVFSSTNMVQEDFYGTITNNTTATIPNEAYNVVLSSFGHELHVPFNTNKVSWWVTSCVTDYNWAEEDYFTNIVAGVQEIKYANCGSGDTPYIVSSVNLAKDKLIDLQLVPCAIPLVGGDVTLGNSYSLKTAYGSRDDIITAVSTTLANCSWCFPNIGGDIQPSVVIKANKPSGSMRHIATNYGLKALYESNEFEGLSEQKYKPSDSTMGVSVTLMAKKHNVDSYIAYATLDRDTNTLTYGENQKISYDATDSGSFNVKNSNGLTVYIAIPNNPNTSAYSLVNDVTGSKVFDACTEESIYDESGLREVATSVGATVLTSNLITENQTIKVGCDSAGYGYSILVLQLKGNAVRKSTLELYDYELNYIYPSMLTSGNYAILLDTMSYDPEYKITLGKGTCNEFESVVADGVQDKYVWADRTYGGNIINKNRTLGSNKNILQYDEITGGYFTTERRAREGIHFGSNLTNVKFSLAVNLIRSSFGDKRVISSISGQTIDRVYAKQNLELEFGNVPNSIANASAKRDSNALVGTDMKDLFVWNIHYSISQSPYQINIAKAVKDECNKNKLCPNYYWNTCKPVVYYLAYNTEVPGSFDGTKVTYDITERAYKYQTDALETAVNNVKTVPNSLRASNSGLNGTSSLSNPYRVAVINSSNKTLSFYPEVRMRAYSSTGERIVKSLNTSGSSDRELSGAVVPHTVLTMGELKRSLKPSSMYAITVTDGNNNAVTGTTLSDSTAVGSGASSISGGLPVIYAGGNVSLNVEANFRLNMYSYSLDLIDTTDTNLVGTGGYSSVVADNSNIKQIWGNNNSYKPLDDFNNWVDATLGKLAVDTTLTVKGDGVDKMYNNFATSIGAMQDQTAVSDGVFNIRVQKGTIVDDGGYQALMNQIKSDYGLNSIAEAKALFEKSDIYQTIARAVEDSSDSFNTSRYAKAIDPNREHWYDEEVKTFVIRRFKVEDIAIDNILVDDKIDYNAAPTGSATSDELKKATAKWYLTLYFKELPTGFNTNATLYNPANYSSLGSANSSGTVIVNQCYISGADFIVPSSSTHDMGN